ncbi:MAG: LamG-like jellyroll fold domain-containing protein [Bacteroidales bacterium]
MKSKILQFSVALLICIASSHLLRAQSFSDNIVSRWNFDEESGFFASDEVTMVEAEILGDSIEWIEGVNGNALDFSNAVDTTILLVDDTGNLSALDFPTESFSVALWARLSMDLADDREQILLCKGSIGKGGIHGPNSNGDRYLISVKRFTGKFEIRFTVDDDATVKTQLGVVPADTIFAEDWVHLAGVRNVDEKMLYLYFNGAKIGEMADTAVEINTAGQPLQIGNYISRASLFKGPIDEVLIIDKALSGEEVDELYKNEFGKTGFHNEKAAKNMVIAPNPVKDELIIRNASNLTKIEIYSITGQMVKTISNQRFETIRYNVDLLPAGYYIVKGYNNSEISTGSFIIK